MLYSTKIRNWNRRSLPKKPNLICYQNSYPTSSRIFRCARIFREVRTVYTWGFSPTSSENFMYVLWYIEHISTDSCDLGTSWNTVLNYPSKTCTHLLAQPSFLVSKQMPWTLLFRKWIKSRHVRDVLTWVDRAEKIPSLSILLCLFSNTAS